jgi:heme oxygenase
VINYPNEFGILFNILRGYIKTWKIPLVINTNEKIDRESLQKKLIGEKTLDYLDYLNSIKDDKNKLMAHIYVRHMGDLFGGQMIRKVLPFPHRNLDFNDVTSLKEKVRAKLDDSLGAEANVAFDWAIKIMRDYDRSLG